MFVSVLVVAAAIGQFAGIEHVGVIMDKDGKLHSAAFDAKYNLVMMTGPQPPGAVMIPGVVPAIAGPAFNVVAKGTSAISGNPAGKPHAAPISKGDAERAKTLEKQRKRAGKPSKVAPKTNAKASPKRSG
jgi:hypothetical protein